MCSSSHPAYSHAASSSVIDQSHRAPTDERLVSVARRSVLLTSWGGPTVTSFVVSTMPSVTAMPSVPPMKHVHRHEGNGDQYPDPIR